MFLDLHVRCPIFLPEVNKVPVLLTYIKKGLYIKFHKNTSRGSHADRQTDRQIHK
jgi:hypothetical protein